MSRSEEREYREAERSKDQQNRGVSRYQVQRVRRVAWIRIIRHELGGSCTGELCTGTIICERIITRSWQCRNVPRHGVFMEKRISIDSCRLQV